MIDPKLIEELKFVLDAMADKAFYEWEETHNVEGLSDRDKELWCKGYQTGRLEENFENRKREDEDETT